MVSEMVQIGVCLNVCGIKAVFFGKQGRLHDKPGPENITQDIVSVEREWVLLFLVPLPFRERTRQQK